MPGRSYPKLGLPDLADDYLAASATINAPSTVERKRGILAHLIRELGDLPLADIGPADVERYRWRRREHVSGGCVNRELATLSHLFNWARRLGYWTAVKSRSSENR